MNPDCAWHLNADGFQKNLPLQQAAGTRDASPQPSVHDRWCWESQISRDFKDEDRSEIGLVADSVSY